MPETWGGGMVGLAGAGRLAVEEGKGWLGVYTAWGKPPSLMPLQELLSAVASAGNMVHTGCSSFRPLSTSVLSLRAPPRPSPSYCHVFQSYFLHGGLHVL